MENTQYSQENSPSTIYFVEEMKPEYLEYIDSCKERAQTDSAYWQELKESMSRGMIQLTDNIDNVSEHNDTDADTQYDESNVSADDVSEESIRSLLEYQIKMLENMNYAIDMLTEKCDELTKYCSKLAKRLKKYNTNDSTAINPLGTDVSGIINSNIPSVNIPFNANIIPQNMNGKPFVNRTTTPVIVPIQNKSQSETVTNISSQSRTVKHTPAQFTQTLTHISDQSVTDETDNSDNDGFTETNSVENTNVKQVDL